MDEMGDYHANLNVVIRGNDLKSIGGDGIVPQTSFKVLMEYNRVNGAASRSEAYNAGLWAWNSDSALIQYNEVCNTNSVRDGMAFDCDAYSVGHICQYNYSHHNKGGFLLFHGYLDEVPDAMNIGHIIRYNFSVNDGDRLFHFYGSGQTQSVIHNNMFFNKKTNVIPIIVEGKPLDVALTGNIFHIPYMAEWRGVHSIGQFIFTDNILSSKNRFISENNTIRKAVRNDLYLLLNQPYHGKPNKAIKSKMIRQFWNNYTGDIFKKKRFN
jgi:hypothetical protein